MVRMVYEAIQEKPLHPCCTAVRKDGISNVMKLKDDIPLGLNLWMKFEANQQHQGSSCSPSETIMDTQEAETGWEAYRKGRKITVANCPPRGELSYPKLKANYIFQTLPEPVGKQQRFHHGCFSSRHAYEIQPLGAVLGVSRGGRRLLGSQPQP